VARRLVAGTRVGELEGEVLDVLWSAGDWLTGREIGERLGERGRAYTTVLTVLARLVDKGLVERSASPDGTERAHRFRAAGDPDELTARAIRSLLAASRDPRAALARFVEDLDDPALLAGLAEVLAPHRRESPR
jgi:predicted transcriptional regulator